MMADSMAATNLGKVTLDPGLVSFEVTTVGNGTIIRVGPGWRNPTRSRTKLER
jgi:hypothetical protein